MITTLNGIFTPPKPYKINFIQENKRKLKEISMVNQSSRSRLDMAKSKNSQTDIGKSFSSASTFKDSKNFPGSKCRLSTKGSMVVFMQDKKEKGSISNVSLSTKRRSSHKVLATKNQSSQTIDPRRCDQLFHDGIIKYPSNKILQELAEIEKQKANRLDVHVKKEFFKRNKVKQKNHKKIPLMRGIGKVSEKGDIGGNENGSFDEDEEEEEEEDEEDDGVVKPADDKELEEEGEDEDDHEYSRESEQSGIPVATSKTKNSPPHSTMCAAEIIRRTTETLNSPKKHIQFDHIPNSKGDSRGVKKTQKISKDEEILKTVLDPNCPPGHIPLPDGERKKTLHLLRVSHAELVREMNLLPVRTDTLRVRQKKMHLEAQLNKIEEGIKVFNKSKVYVKIEEE